MQSAARPHPMNVKLILPVLTEATDPYWRPIKYSLFPPLGLATRIPETIQMGPELNPQSSKEKTNAWILRSPRK